MKPDLSLHLVTDERVDLESLVNVVDEAVGAGVGVVQVRRKDDPARAQIDLVQRLSLAIAGRAALLVNDRLDVALAARDAGATVDGVHLGQDDVPPTTARRVLGSDALIGWTADTAEHLVALAAMPLGTVDYLGVGVVRVTGSKPDHPAVLGIDGIGRIATATSLPCVAIGGVVADDVAHLRHVGVAGVAVVSAILDAAEPAVATQALLGRPGAEIA